MKAKNPKTKSKKVTEEEKVSKKKVSSKSGKKSKELPQEAPASKKKKADREGKSEKKAAPKKTPTAAKKQKAKKGVVEDTGRPAPVIWEAPDDFKPHFLSVQVRTDKDGMFTNMIEATRYVGAYNEEAPGSKKFDLRSYDADTLMGIQARLALVTFHPTGRLSKAGVSPRLQPDTTYKLLYRVGVRKANNALTVGLKSVVQQTETTSAKTGKVRIKEVQLERSEPDFRKLLKSAKFLPAAFANVLQPPKPVRGGKRKAEDEEDDE